MHFAVSSDEVYMTTQLKGKDTFFLPFNKGHNEGSGNPPNPNGYVTSYLWEEIFPKDTWLKILGSYIHHSRMKTSKFTDSQIMNILKQAESGITVSELFREFGMSSATFYKWRAKYGGMDISMIKRLKELEDENRRLKKMYAEECLKLQVRQEALEG